MGKKAGADLKRLSSTQLSKVADLMSKELEAPAAGNPVAKSRKVAASAKSPSTAAAAPVSSSRKRPAADEAPASPAKKAKKAEPAAKPAAKAAAKPAPAKAAKPAPKAAAPSPAKVKPPPAKAKTTPAKVKPPPAKAAAAEPKPSPKQKSAKKAAEIPAEEVRTVEQIVGVRSTASGDNEFLIKWSGLSARANTWEPEAHILDDSLVDEFMQANLLALAPKGGKYAVGAAVDVLGEADGFACSWAPAKVRKAGKAGYEVEFDDFMEGKSRLVEKDVAFERLRPLQPKAPPKKWHPAVGDLIEVFEDDCWWEAKYLKPDPKKKAKGAEPHLLVKLRVSDESKSYPLSVARPSCWWSLKLKH